MHYKATFYMIAMNMNDRVNCYCHLFSLLVFLINATFINSYVNNKDIKPTLVFFRWSAGFGRNFQAIRCATDQSSEDPSNRLVDIYPEMKSLYEKLKLTKIVVFIFNIKKIPFRGFSTTQGENLWKSQGRYISMTNAKVVRDWKFSEPSSWRFWGSQGAKTIKNAPHHKNRCFEFSSWNLFTSTRTKLGCVVFSSKNSGSRRQEKQNTTKNLFFYSRRFLEKEKETCILLWSTYLKK